MCANTEKVRNPRCYNIQNEAVSRNELFSGKYRRDPLITKHICLTIKRPLFYLMREGNQMGDEQEVRW